MQDSPYLIPRITRPFDVALELPGSKSIALRQMAMCAMTEGKSVLRGVPVCDDSLAMAGCLEKLGLFVNMTENAVEIAGPMNLVDSITLDARMSGASARLLIALAALRSGVTYIDGHESLQARTNQPLLDTLEKAGCKIESSDGHLPLSIQGPIKPTSPLVIDGSISSQYVTALLVISVGLDKPISDHISIEGDLVSKPYVDITLNEMQKRGIRTAWENDQTIRIDRQGGYQKKDLHIEGDATAASYAATLACIHKGRATFTNLGNSSLQGDYRYLEILKKLGAEVTSTESTTTVEGPKKLMALKSIDMKEMPDTALTLIALAPLLEGEITISGLSSLHHKECDRLECPAAEMVKMGIAVKTTNETITIQPATTDKIKSLILSTYHDHRMAMAFSLIGSVTGNLTIDDQNVVNKTYPNFWEDYQQLL